MRKSIWVIWNTWHENAISTSSLAAAERLIEWEWEREGKRERLCRAELVRWRIYSNLCTIDDDKSLIFGARSHTMRIFNAYLVVMYFAYVLFFTVPSVRHSNAATFFFLNVILFFRFKHIDETSQEIGSQHST